MVMGCAAASV